MSAPGKPTSAAAARRAARETAGAAERPVQLPTDVATRIVKYVPLRIDTAVWAAIRSTVVEIVVSSDPTSPDVAQHRMLPVAKLAAWAHSQGVPLDPATLLSEFVIEEWARQAIASGEPKSSTATYRSILRKVAATAGTPSVKTTATISRSGGAVPYTADEDLALRRAVMGQRTPVYRASGCLLYGLARGAGLNAAAIRQTRRDDVIDHGAGAGGIEVHVDGRSLWALDSHLDVIRLGLETSTSTGYLLGGRDGQRRNIAEYVSRFTVPDGTPHLNIGRCRSTWILDHLRRGTPIKVIADALGTRSLNQIEALLTHVDSPDPAPPPKR